jgi:hypothetical protein
MSKAAGCRTYIVFSMNRGRIDGSGMEQVAELTGGVVLGIVCAVGMIIYKAK